MGHHGGIPNGGSGSDTGDDTTLKGRLHREVKDYSYYKPEIEVPNLAFPSEIRPISEAGFTLASLVKMVHSCLVDADFQDTQQFMSDLKVCRGGYETLQTLNDTFFKYMNKFK